MAPTHHEHCISESISRLLKTSFAPQDIKLLAFNPLIISKLEYAAPMWSPRQVYLINELQSVQNCATWFINSPYSNDISISSFKRETGLANLFARRRITSLFAAQVLSQLSLSTTPHHPTDARISPHCPFVSNCPPTSLHYHVCNLIFFLVQQWTGTAFPLTLQPSRVYQPLRRASWQTALYDDLLS